MPTRTFGSFSMPYRRTNSAIGNASYCPIVTAIRQFVSHINHIELENKTVYLRLNNGTSEAVNVSMDELEQQLNPDCFFRANRQYIINVEHVLFLGNYFGGKLIVRLKGYPDTRITVSKEKAQRLKEWIDR